MSKYSINAKVRDSTFIFPIDEYKDAIGWFKERKNRVDYFYLIDRDKEEIVFRYERGDKFDI